jgi:hypothetical protein
VTDDPRIDWGQGEWLEEVQRLEAELEQAEKLAGLNEALADGYAKALWEAEARLEKADKLAEALRDLAPLQTLSTKALDALAEWKQK